MEQDLDLDEGMWAFENVQQFTLTHDVVLAVLLFNAGQACRRVNAFDKASTLYTAAKHALDVLDDKEGKTDSLLSQPSKD
eukprot:15071211-Ditylum_brightwellii.AAC.1